MPPKRKAKRDLSEAPIVDKLRSLGMSVDYINEENIPDLIVGYNGKNFLLEIKTGKRKLSPGQTKWHNNWKGQRAVVRTPREALLAIGIPESELDDM